MGCKGTFVGRLLTFMCWHSAHPLTYSAISCRIFGHQYEHSRSCTVLLIPGCPYIGGSWRCFINSLLPSSAHETTRLLSLYQTPDTRLRLWGSIHGLMMLLSCDNSSGTTSMVRTNTLSGKTVMLALSSAPWS